jgi:hypothetical protein
MSSSHKGLKEFEAENSMKSTILIREFSIAVTLREIDFETCLKDMLNSVLREYFVGARKTNSD